MPSEAYYAGLFDHPAGSQPQQPLFSGQAPFGDRDRFTAAPFTGGPLAEDAFLGLPPGTTQYGPCAPGGGAIACRGFLTGNSEGAVAQAQATLAAFAGLDGSDLVVPTGLGIGGWDVWHSCRFLAGDLAWSEGGIVPSQALGAGSYEIAYAIVFRRAAGPLT